MISVHAISKQFKLYRSPTDRLREIVTRKKYHTDFHALNNVSFTVKDGETLGIVGQNGAGKSTLLKILTGILLPDNGKISVDGKITGLLELGTGFNQEMTGIENIYMNGTLLGMSNEEIDRKRDAIIDFTELGDFIHEQIKTYSSGMVMRLAFSVAIHADPKCFVVDEALSVGDAYFQQKCMKRISDFRNSGGSIIFVSHDMNAVKTLCDSAVMLDQGNIILYSNPKEVIDYYHGMIMKKSHLGESVVEVIKKKGGESNNIKANGFDVGTGEVELVSLTLLNEDNNRIDSITSENIIKIEFVIRSFRDLSDPHYGIVIRNKLGVSIFETNTCCMNIKTQPLKQNEAARIIYTVNCNLSPGDYSITVGVANKCFNKGSFEEYLLLNHDIKMLIVMNNEHSIHYAGVYNMKPKVVIEKC